jgi:hypothetical protein
MSVMFFQKVIKSLRDIGGDVSLMTLLTYISRDVPDHKQLLPTPDLQRGLTRLQLTTT